MSQIIRIANVEDIPGINNLLKQVLLIHHNIRKDIFKKEGSKYTDDELKIIIENETTPVFVCVDDDNNVLGHLFCRVQNKVETNNTYARKTLFIDDICIDEAHRGQSIGTNLYKFVKQYAIENRFHNITLDVWEGNDKAKKFYEKLGLKPQQIIMEENID